MLIGNNIVGFIPTIRPKTDKVEAQNG